MTQQFNSVQAKRKERFLEAFNVISEEITKVYTELTEVDGIGGTAYLSLEDPSEPFLHGVSPAAP